MKPFRDFISSHFQSLNRTLLVWPLILFIIFLTLISLVEKRKLDEALQHHLSAHLFLYEHFAFTNPESTEESFSFYLKKGDLFYDPSTGKNIQPPVVQDSNIRYLIQKSQPNKAGDELIVMADRLSFYGNYLVKFAPYIPIALILYIGSYLLFRDLNHFWLKRYEALHALLKNADGGNFSKLIRPLPHDYLKGMLFCLNLSIIAINELYVSLNGWIQELKALNLSPQINHKVDQIADRLHEKYQFEGEKIHLSYLKIHTSPSYFMLFLLYFSEGFFMPFFNYYFVQNIKSSFLDYLLIFLTIFFSFSLYSLFQRQQNKSMIFILCCLLISILGKVILGYEMINDQEVIIFYAASLIAQFLAISFYLFILFRPFEIKKISLYIATGSVSGLLTGLILQANELAIPALFSSIFWTYLVIFYFFFMPQEKYR